MGEAGKGLVARIVRGAVAWETFHQSNIARLALADIMVVDDLSKELSLGYSLADMRPEGVKDTPELVTWSGVIGIYSLDESALHRAGRMYCVGCFHGPTFERVTTESLRIRCVR